MPAAVDTNILISLADGAPDVWDAVETLRKKAGPLDLLVSPTVIEETVYFSRLKSASALRRFARIALENLVRSWMFQPGHLTAVQHGIVERTANHLRHNGIIPTEERHDSFIIVEAAMLQCVLLVSDDGEMRAVDFSRLTLELRRFDLVAPVIATLAEIIHKFYR